MPVGPLQRLGTWKLRIALVGLVAITVVLGSIGAGAAPAPVGNTTYFINGQETVFTYDPLGKGRAIVLPEEIFQRMALGIRTGGRDIWVSRGTTEVKTTLGSTLAIADDTVVTLGATPLRQSGRLYLPADVLNYLGYEWTGDNLTLEIRDLTKGSLPQVQQMRDEDWAAMKAKKGFETSFRLDGIYILGSVALVTPEWVQDVRIPLTSAARAKALALLDNYTLFYVELRNDQSKAVQFLPGQIFLVDSKGRPLEYTGQYIDVQGTIASKVGPRATKAAVLVFPKLKADAVTLGIYHDVDIHWLGTITL